MKWYYCGMVLLWWVEIFWSKFGIILLQSKPAYRARNETFYYPNEKNFKKFVKFKKFTIFAYLENSRIFALVFFLNNFTKIKEDMLLSFLNAIKVKKIFSELQNDREDEKVN